MRRGRMPTPSTPTSLLILPIVLGGLVWGSSTGGADRAGSPGPAPAAASTPVATSAGGGATEAGGESGPSPVATDAAEGAMPAVRLASRGADADETERADATELRDETERADIALLEDLRGRVEDLIPGWRNSRWGVLVTSLDRGDTLVSRNAHEPLAPASNVKLLTTAAALHHLGEDYRYRTFLMTDAPVEGGVLKGDLVLYGTGDPTLADDPGRRDREALRTLARQLLDRGVRAVEGDVVGDGSYFEGSTRPASWGSRNLNEWFATPVGALQYNENVATLRIGPGSAVGRPVRVRTVPEEAPVPLVVRARTVSRRTGHRVWALRDELDEPVVLTGQMEPGDSEIWRRMPVADPSLYAAERMRAILEEEGVRVAGMARSVRKRERSLLADGAVWAPGIEERSRPTVLAEHRSDPLIQILWTVNRESHNLYAESVVRTLGRVVEGDASFDGGARVVRRFLVEEAGVPEGEAAPLDGSGLSPDNRVSPFALVRVIDHMSRGPHWGAFWSTLPQAGNFRELRRMYRTPAAENLRAKTGTLRSVSALTGMVRARNGERLAFSVVSNDVPSTSAAKAVEDRLGIQLASFWRSGGPDQLLESGGTLAAED